MQLGLTPRQAGPANAPLRLTSRGIATQLLWPDARSLAIGFDLAVRQLRFELSDGTRRALLLEPRPVADFYAAVTATLAELGVDLTIDPTSVETGAPVSLSTNTGHASYDRGCVSALFQAWTRVAAVFDRFRSGFCGRQTPVDLWWGTFDLSVVRYSGRPASPPFDSGAIERVAMDAEQSLVGFWPGDDTSPAPVFFSYTYPKPAGIDAATVTPPGAQWSPGPASSSCRTRRSAVPPTRPAPFWASASRPTAPALAWPAGIAPRSNATRRRTGAPESGDASMRGRPSLPGPADRRPGRRTRGGGRCRR